MSLREIRRFRADAIKHRILIDHIEDMEWDDVVDFANSHGYQFDLEESRNYFDDIHRVTLKEHAMTKVEIFAWNATENPNALVDDSCLEDKA